MYDDPAALAATIAALPRRVLLALDVDGVLSPIVSHADEARLTPGVAEVLRTLAHADGVDVAVISGRSLDGLRQFAIDPAITLIGSHGAEVAGDPPPVLTSGQEALLTRLIRLACTAAEEAGEGAWVEHKPTSVALHVRQAPPDTGGTARDALLRAAEQVDGAIVKPGSSVVELMARPADKGHAIAMLRERHHPASTVFVGDDVTDEDGFRVLRDGDLGIKVGAGHTIAARRLEDPGAVHDWLRALAAHTT